MAETEYVSGEQHQAMMTTQPGSRSSRRLAPKLVAAAVVVLLMAGSFYGGIAYQKGHQPKSTAATAVRQGGPGSFGGNGGGGGFDGGGRFGGQRPTIGQVTAVSSSSITVQDSNSGSSTTLSITSSTQITDNGQTVAASDIQVGDTVLVTASTSDTTQAARILVNPSFGGAPDGGGSSSGNSTTDSTVTTD